MSVITSLALSISVSLGSPIVAAEMWPNAVWENSTLQSRRVNEIKFREFINHVFAKSSAFTTDGLVVIKDGYLIYEDGNGYKGTDKHALWSLGKPIGNALIGLAEKAGYLDRHGSAARYFPRFHEVGLGKLKISDLMYMSSGLTWIEEDPRDLFASDTIAMFYSKLSHQDSMMFVTSKPLCYWPGTVFNYSSADSLLLMAVLRGAVGERRFASFPWTALFEKLKMTSVTIERDRRQNLLLPYFAWASARYVARIGLLFARRGRWQ